VALKLCGIGKTAFRKSPNNKLMLDEDLNHLDAEQLIREIIKLRNGIREHRDSSGHELCWHHPNLWNLLPEKTDPKIEVPDWPEFMRGCIHYRNSLEERFKNKE
jgi:hypothetical protein